MSDMNIKDIIETARQGVPFQTIERDTHYQVVYLPHGAGGQGEIVTVNLEKHQSEPARKRGVVAVFDAASFSRILEDNQDAGDITVYIDRNPDKPAIVGVMNGHGAKGPGWGDFRVSMVFRETPQWAKWRKIDGQMLDQAAFAEFIEDNLSDIADPSGAEVLEIASYLEATRSVDFRSAIRLPSGQVQFRNEEKIEAKVKAGEIAVPEIIALGIAPIQGLPPFRVEARFRYRIQDGRLKLGVRLQRVEDLMREVIEQSVSALVLPEGAARVEGIPPAAA